MMTLENLLKSNVIQWELKDIYLERIIRLYPEYNIFLSYDFPGFVTFRLKTDHELNNHLNDIHIHYTQLYSISR